MALWCRKWKRLLLSTSAVLLLFFLILTPLQPRAGSLDLDQAMQTQVQILGKDAARPDEDTTVHDPCTTTPCQSSPFLLAMYITAPTNFAQRDALRDVWKVQDQENSLGVEVKRYFFVGMPEREEDLVKLTKESENFQDLVLDNFQDSYLNLTVKVLRMLKWVNGNFPAADFLMKIDDDVHVNIPPLLTYLTSLNKTQAENLIGGMRHRKNAPITDPKSKWYVPKALWRERYYPDFAGGPAYLLGSTAREELYKGALETSVFPLEDVFLTGIVRRTFFPVPVQDITGNSDWYLLNRVKFPCKVKTEYTFIHPVASKEVRCYSQLGKWCENWSFVPMILLC